MKDKEAHEILLADRPNAHILVWGQAGRGKTYFCCRQLERFFEEGKRSVILDFSGSYTEDELEKSEFKYMKQMKSFEVGEKPFYWLIPYAEEETLIEDLKDALVASLKIESYYQKKLLRIAIQRCLKKHKQWNIPQLLEILERMLQEKKFEENAKDDIQNLEHLLSRLAPYDSIRKFYIKLQLGGSIKRKERITVIQLTNLPEQQRRFMTDLLSSLVWKECRRLKTMKRFDAILFDEFHFLSVKSGSSLAQILREGRKYGVCAIFSTQYVSHYSQEEILALQQAGNILIFQPARRDLRFSAEIIDPNQSNLWKEVLKNLQIGEAILVGNYKLTAEGKIMSFPIVCRI